MFYSTCNSPPSEIQPSRCFAAFDFDFIYRRCNLLSTLLLSDAVLEIHVSLLVRNESWEVAPRKGWGRRNAQVKCVPP